MNPTLTRLNDATAKLATLEALWNSGLAGMTGGITGVSPCPHCVCEQQMISLTNKINMLQTSYNLQQSYTTQQQSLDQWLASNDATLITAVLGNKINAMTADQLTTINNNLQVLSATMSVGQLQALYA